MSVFQISATQRLGGHGPHHRFLRTATCVAILGAIVVIGSLIPRGASAQSSALARRISAAPDGRVRFVYAARPGVCGNGNHISRGNSGNTRWSYGESADVVWDEECSVGPVRIVAEVGGGRVTKLRTFVGGRWRPATGTVTDLGVVSARDASDYLLSLVSTSTDRVAKEAIFPATIADSVVIWPALLRVARDESRPAETRKQAVFWIGQAAGDAITANLASLVGENEVDREIRESAVFALSQQRNGEAVPALIRIARTNRDPHIRKSALFWLGQSKDPRALALFEEILTRR